MSRNARLKNNKIWLRRIFTVDKKNCGKHKFQFSIHVTIHHPSITMTWCIFCIIFYLFTIEKEKNHTTAHKSIIEAKTPCGCFLSIFQRPFFCFCLFSHSLSVNQKALYHSFLFLYYSGIAFESKKKNTCVKLRDTQNSHLDWWSDGTEFSFGALALSVHEVLMSLNRFSQYFFYFFRLTSKWWKERAKNNGKL